MSPFHVVLSTLLTFCITDEVIIYRIKLAKQFLQDKDNFWAKLIIEVTCSQLHYFKPLTDNLNGLIIGSMEMAQMLILCGAIPEAEAELTLTHNKFRRYIIGKRMLINRLKDNSPDEIGDIFILPNDIRLEVIKLLKV
jgi:hypothetical protein